MRTSFELVFVRKMQMTSGRKTMENGNEGVE